MKNIYFFYPFIITILALTCVVPLHINAQSSYWQQQLNYTIDVTLNDTEHTLDAFEKIDYINNSPDTLRYIWFHVWPNAYRNDKTAFSEQLLVNNRTDFYFSNREQKGYINRLDFKVDGVTARTEDHPRYIDVIKLLLPAPLPPHRQCAISTPFHVKLPDNFSRGGHEKQSYQVTQWYPKPAVYNKYGWHPMPYLDQGEFFSEFGNYDVRITVPGSYVVAATGACQNADEMAWLKKKAGEIHADGLTTEVKKNKRTKKTSAALHTVEPDTTKTKELRYLQNNVHDFAWFADKDFIVRVDTLALASGKVIDVYSFCLPSGNRYWKNSIAYCKNAITTRSAWLGEYPYSTVTAVEAKMGFNGGMEYPAITCISPVKSERELEKTIVHEVGHNWLYGILATDERTYPWMDEGMNTYYDWRYANAKLHTAGKGLQSTGNTDAGGNDERMESMLFETLAAMHKDQPINTASADFTETNYWLMAYYKAAAWMQLLETSLGRPLFDSCMHEYYRQWQFKHPYPSDFKQIVATVSNTNVDALFAKLEQQGNLQPIFKNGVSIVPIIKLKSADKQYHIGIAPAVGANLYDGLMIGAFIHNYQLPLPRLQFAVAPLFATRSKQWNGIARVSYSWYPGNVIYRVDAGAAAAKFSMDTFKPENAERLFAGFTKVAPFIRVTLKETNPLSKMERYLQFKTFLIGEGVFQFSQVITGPDTLQTVNVVTQHRVLNQLKFVVRNARALYPYKGEFVVEQQKSFIRATFTGNYYFNYANNVNGMQARLFAGKFIYSGANTPLKQVSTDRYHLNMTGANGYEDYTYSNYFAGRNTYEGWSSQQIMLRDGGFKLRTDLLSSKVGKTDDWLVAGNFSTGIPKNINPLQILPFSIPVKIFADIGTYAEAWNKDAATGKFLFDAGLQLSLFKGTLNIYVPVVYSSVYKDYYRSTYADGRFWKTISFSIDIQDFNLRKIDPRIPF